MKWFFSFCLFFNLKNFTGNRNSKTRKGKARAARGRRPGISWRNVLPEEGCPCERERERENGAKSKRGGQERDVVGKKKGAGGRCGPCGAGARWRRGGRAHLVLTCHGSRGSPSRVGSRNFFLQRWSFGVNRARRSSAMTKG